MLEGKIAVDIKLFWWSNKGKRERGTSRKVTVFGLLKRNGQVYTVAITNTQTATLLPIMSEKVKPDSIVYTDCYRSYGVFGCECI